MSQHQKSLNKLNVHEDVRIAKTYCTNCGQLLDGCAAVAEGEPRETRPDPGDVTVCISCGHIMAFDENLQLRDLTETEAKDIAGDPAILAIQKGRAAYERAKALSGGSPPGHPGDSIAKSLPAGVPSTDRLGQDTSGSDDR